MGDVTIGVFCSSAEDVDLGFHELAARLGRAIGQRGWRLLYGGTPSGTMGSLVGAAREAGAHVTGIVLQRFVDLGIHDLNADDLMVTESLGVRKEEMIARSDALVALPGGFGTLDELVEVISLRQIGVHEKPLVLVDHEGFYLPLLSFFEVLHHHRLAYANTLGTYEAVESVEAAVTTLVRHFAAG